MNELLAHNSDAPWEQIAPHLDAALDTLTEADHDAVMLRYFERKPAHEMAQALGISEEAAQKRLTRAVERLREFFAKRGVTVGASGLAAAISGNAIQAAPAGLAAAATASILETTVATTVIATTTKTIAMTTLQKTLIAATIVAVGTTVYQAHRASRLQDQLLVLQQQASQDARAGHVRQEQTNAADSLETLRQENEQLRRNQAELPRLRGEVARLRNIAQGITTAKSASNNPGELEMKSWLDRVSQLKQRLRQMPEAGIPELQLATEQDWLDATQDKLETDADFRKAMSRLRGTAENKFRSLMQSAVRKFTEANNGRAPKEVSELQPFFESPVDPSMLQRWEVAQADAVSSVELGGDWIITQKAPVDAEYDQRQVIGAQGSGTTSFDTPEKIEARKAVSDLLSQVGAAINAYSAAHNGRPPENPSQLLPFVTTPAEQAALEKLIQNAAQERQRRTQNPR